MLLQDYRGNIFLINHDRAFLENIVTQVIAFEGDGVLREYAGGYSDWASYQSRNAALQPEAIEPLTAGKTAAVSARPAPRRAATSAEARLSFNEQRELSVLPAHIESLELRIGALRDQLADPALYRQAPGQVKALHAELAQVDGLLAVAYARWEDLEKHD